MRSLNDYKSALIILLAISIVRYASPDEQQASQLPDESLKRINHTLHWPSFRGERASGVALGYKTPIHWNIESGENIKWKTPIPGLGLSSPAIWGNRLFITSAVKQEGEATLKPGLYGDIEPVKESGIIHWHVLCLDKTNGQILWDKQAHQGSPRIKRHPKSSHANSTPATDGKHVVAFFGSEGLFCYDMEGRLLWNRDLGLLESAFYVVPSAQWGFGSSPIIHDGLVIVQCDVLKNSFLAAFNIENGQEVWRTPRHDVPTWSTPTIVSAAGAEAQVVVNGYRHIGGYNISNGRELWSIAGGGDIPVPTPITAHGLIFITSAHGGPPPIYAIRQNATGIISPESDKSAETFIAWSKKSGGNYLPTPIVVNQYLYMCSNNGTFACYRAVNGQRVYSERLGVSGGFTASPVSADQKIYMTSETGTVLAMQAGPEFKILARNPLGESCLATPSISEGNLYFRTRSHIIAIAEEKDL